MEKNRWFIVLRHPACRRVGAARGSAGQRLGAVPGAAARAAPGGGVGGQPPPAGPPVPVQARTPVGCQQHGSCAMWAECFRIRRHMVLGVAVFSWPRPPAQATSPVSWPNPPGGLHRPVLVAGSWTRSSALPSPLRWCPWTSRQVGASVLAMQAASVAHLRMAPCLCSTDCYPVKLCRRVAHRVTQHCPLPSAHCIVQATSCACTATLPTGCICYTRGRCRCGHTPGLWLVDAQAAVAVSFDQVPAVLTVPLLLPHLPLLSCSMSARSWRWWRALQCWAWRRCCSMWSPPARPGPMATGEKGRGEL